MPPLLSALGRAASMLLVFGAAISSLAQSPTKSGGEYPIIGAQPQDQINPQVAINEFGGYVVWQDFAADGKGWGINARRLNSTLSGEFSIFRVNEIGEGNQENPQVALLADGKTVFVWQGGSEGHHDIYYRIADTNGVFVSTETIANTYTKAQQFNPSLAASPNGGFTIVWTSEDQDGSFLGIFGQRFNSEGAKAGSEFRANVTTQFSQRSPAVAYLSSGNLAVAWVSENLVPVTDVLTNRVGRLNVAANLMARLYTAGGEPLTGEFRVNNATNIICANPTIVPFESGEFLVTWSAKDIQLRNESWDIYTRSYSANGTALAGNVIANVHRYGDQFRPQGAVLGGRQFLVWSSMGQDGSYEGVYGRFLSNGVPVGMDQRINTTTVSKQIQPALATDRYTRLLVVWSSFVGRGNGFDLFAQRYVGEGVPQLRPPAPHVSALSQSRLSVAWPELAGYALDGYQLTIDNTTTVQLTQNYYIVSGLVPASAHSFTLAYRYSDGRVSPASQVTHGTTWAEDTNDDTLPDDWQIKFFGTNPSNWASANSDSDGDGVTNYREFLLGTNPMDSNSVLKTRIYRGQGGRTLSWNAEPGFVYQVQTSTDLRAWANYGQPHFAASNTGSVSLAGSENRLFYRVIRIR